MEKFHTLDQVTSSNFLTQGTVKLRKQNPVHMKKKKKKPKKALRQCILDIQNAKPYPTMSTS